MSRYFQTLKKLQQQRGEETPNSSPPAAEPSPPPISAPAPKWQPEAPEEVFPELPLAHRDAAWSHMLESLRAESQSSQPIFVVAGVSDVESTRRLVTGLCRQAANRGVSVRAASLTQSQEGRLLSLVSGGFDENSLSWGPDEAIMSSTGPPAIRGFELSGSQIDQNLAEWLNVSSSGSDLLLIEAPGVLSSADTVLLAKTCDGLALVVEPLITDRTALKAAVSRAKTSGCRVVGLIVSGHRAWIPRWLQRLLPE